MRVRHKFHPQIRPSEPNLPWHEVEKFVALSDGRVVLHKVKVFPPVAGNGVDPKVRPTCLNERIRWDPRKGTTRVG